MSTKTLMDVFSLTLICGPADSSATFVVKGAVCPSREMGVVEIVLRRRT